MLKVVKRKIDSSLYQLKVMAIVSEAGLSCSNLYGAKNFIQNSIDKIPRANIAKANGSYKVCFSDESEKVLQVIHCTKNPTVFATITAQ